METKNIEIGLETYKFLEGARASFSETYDDILRRLLGIGRTPTEEVHNEPPKGGMFVDTGFLREGLKLRSRVKADVFEAEVKSGRIYFEGEPYETPSAAAKAAVGYSVNGWLWWQFYDEAAKRWRPLDQLRHR